MCESCLTRVSTVFCFVFFFSVLYVILQKVYLWFLILGLLSSSYPLVQHDFLFYPAVFCLFCFLCAAFLFFCVSVSAHTWDLPHQCLIINHSICTVCLSCLVTDTMVCHCVPCSVPAWCSPTISLLILFMEKLHMKAFYLLQFNQILIILPLNTTFKTSCYT